MSDCHSVLYIFGNVKIVYIYAVVIVVIILNISVWFLLNCEVYLIFKESAVKSISQYLFMVQKCNFSSENSTKNIHFIKIHLKTTNYFNSPSVSNTVHIQEDNQKICISSAIVDYK